MTEFCHLHLHTSYSLLDGACGIDDLMRALGERDMTHCAITDHGTMYGVIDFYQAALKAGIHPIIGCEVYVCDDRNDKQSVAREYAHLVLLCKNNTGYKNLMKISSIGFTEGFYYKPRVDMKVLREYGEGLIALSACLSGEIPKCLLDNQPKQAKQLVEQYREIFGDDFYIELQDHGIPEERLILPKLIQLASETGTPLVATNDVHYINKSDAKAQDVLLCIQTGKTIDDDSRMKMNTDQLYLKTGDEMTVLLGHVPGAIENTMKIAAQCHVKLDFETLHLPKFPLPENISPEGKLRELCNEGLHKRYDKPTQAHIDRLNYELDMIIKMGYVDYFLIVWDFIKYAKDNGIIVGPGRGSGAGSIVAYTLNITGIDPIEYNLLFERFLNPERISMPDLDIDFCYERRQEVIDYVAEKYGQDHVAQIITFGTMAARAAVRDVGRALNMTYAEVDQVAKMVPMALGMTLDRALELNPELLKLYNEDEGVHTLYDTARSLEGMPRHASTHAAGVLITGEPVTNFVPLQKNGEVITTQFPMGTLESLGLLKMDFLGLRTLTVIRDTLESLSAEGINLRIEDIPRDDKEVFAMIGEGDTDGVFQLESGGMRSFLKELKPEAFEDIIAAVSLYRPGPMDSIPKYIAGKHNTAEVEYLSPALEPILGVTYGCMVYQEQVMQIVRDLAGYSMARSDLVRRAMSKKKHDVMAQERAYFVHGRVENGEVIVPGAVRFGIPEDVADRIFEEMSAFASYAFNKSHAAAYALIAMQTGYLRRHHTVAYMAALMNSMLDSTAKIAGYIHYCRKHGIEVLPPDINRSGPLFSSEGGAIRFGLGAVKHTGLISIRAMVKERLNGPYKDIFDFCKRVEPENINSKMLEGLIKAGAFDSTGANRAQLLAVYEKALQNAQNEKRKNVAGQMSLFDMGQAEAPQPQIPDLKPHTEARRLAMEKEVTGIYITGHPLSEYQEELEMLDFSTRTLANSAEDEQDYYDGLPVSIGGIISERRTKVTKNGSLMAFVTLEDMYGSLEMLVFPKVYERFSNLLAADSLVIASGKLSVREEDTPKLLCDSIRPLVHGQPDAPAPQGRLPYQNEPAAFQAILYLNRKLSQAQNVLPLLWQYPGETPVLFFNAETKKSEPHPSGVRVRLEDSLISSLEAALGQENIKVKTR